MQQGILFHTLYASERGAYGVQWSCTLHGALKVSVFKRAWQYIVNRHPVLRTSFNWQLRDEPFQVVSRYVELPWRQHDWRHMSAAEQDQQIEAFLAGEQASGFELSQAPLMRLALLQLANDAYYCVWSMHHLLLDRWSLLRLWREVSQAYDAFCTGRELHLAVSRPYGDYIAWLQQQDMSQAEVFWRQTLKGFITPTALKVGLEHGSFSRLKGGYAEEQMRLPAGTTATLQQLARDYSLSLNTLVQGAWSILLSRYSGQEDVVFGATVASRPTDLTGVESMIGLFINTLPVRVRITPNARLIPWLQEVQIQQVEARHYHYSPLVQVQAWSDVPRGSSLFESLLVFENSSASLVAQEWDGSLQISRVRLLSPTHYPLTVAAAAGPELWFRIGYESQRFDAGLITRLLGHLRILLEGIVANPGQRLLDLPIVTHAGGHQLRAEWNHAAQAYPEDTCFQQLFEAQVAHSPDAVGVVFQDQELTYAELNRRGNQLAHYLRALGVRAEVLVGICLEPSIEMLVGLLGILKAGGAFVPLDPAYPTERLATILIDAQIRVLLTQQDRMPSLPKNATRVLCLDAEWDSIAQESAANIDSGTTVDNSAYVLYTSGSTGKPKGVLIGQRSLVNYICWFKDSVLATTRHHIPLVTKLTFDASLKQLFAPLLLGDPVWILPGEVLSDPVWLVEALQTRNQVMLNCVPSLWEALLDTIDSHQAEQLGETLASLLLGGERVTADLVTRTLTVLPHLQIWNLYGPTEGTANASAARIAASDHITIGRPIANTQIYIVDAHLQPVLFRLSGELYIGGAGLARGYLNQPMLTAERFVPNPFSDTPGTRLYKTGDLASYLSDDNIELLGRLDNQVKIRGYRIELGEVEATLERHPAIRQAIVAMRGDTAADRQLVAYCVPHPKSLLDTRAMRSFLRTQLPDYMVPATFVVLDALPLTLHGKIDRQALPAPAQVRPPLFEVLVAPRTPSEEILEGIWVSVLGVAAIGIHDNFFALGGNSLSAMRLISRLHKVFHVDVSLRALFDAPTIAGLAHHVEVVRQATQRPATPPLRAGSQQGGPLSISQEHLWDLDRLLPGAPFSNMPYAARLTGPLNVPALEQSFNEIVRRHDALRTTVTTVAGRPVQVIAPTLRLPLRVEDLRTLPEAERETKAQRLIRAYTLYPFDLQHGPLLAVWLVRLSEHVHILVLIMHHIISDGWSRDVLLYELTVLYEAFCQRKPSPLPHLPLQYADFAHWQHQWVRSDAGKAQLEYWTQRLDGPLPVLKLPRDRPRTGELSLRTTRRTFQLPRELCAALTRVSHQEGTTLFMTLLAAFKTLLYSYTGQEDIRVATLVANRQHQEIEGLIGLFANLVILRTSLDSDPTLRQLLHRVRTTTLEAYMHQELPFEYLARTLERERHLDRLSLFQVMFSMWNAQPHFPAFPELVVDIQRTQAMEATPCELVMSVRQSPDGLDGVCLYKTALYDEATITRMLGDFQQLLVVLSVQPQQQASTFMRRFTAS